MTGFRMLLSGTRSLPVEIYHSEQLFSILNGSLAPADPVQDCHTYANGWACAYSLRCLKIKGITVGFLCRT